MQNGTHWGHTLKAQNIFLVGASGSVGSTLADQVNTKDRGVNPNLDVEGHHHPTRIVGATSSSHMLIAVPRQTEGLIQLQGGQKKIKKIINTKGVPFGGYEDILGALTTLGLDPSDVIFVDMTADKTPQNTDFHRKVIQLNGSMVGANKNPLSLYEGAIFQELTQDRDRYAYSASVMAGGPAISELQKAYDTRNTVKSIEGCFSGTLAYICSELEKGGNISKIIKSAHKKKYTEPEPWDDLSGLDVARKILILARTAGYYDIEMSDIELEPFLPAEFGQYRGESFFENLKSLDTEWKERMSRLGSQGKTLRYVAEMRLVNGKPKIKVGLKEVDKNSPLGTLQGTNNKVIIETELYTSSYERPGAGPGNTANNVRGDIASILRGRLA